MILVAYRHGLRASEVCDLQAADQAIRGPPACAPRLNALRVASGEPPGFPETPGANLPLMRPLLTLGAVFGSVFALIACAWSEGQRISDSGATLDGGARGGLPVRRKTFAGQSCRGRWFATVNHWQYSPRAVRPGEPNKSRC